MPNLLGAGDKFPALALATTAGQTLSLPGDLDQPWTIVLFYRGHW